MKQKRRESPRQDDQIEKIIRNHSYGVMATMIAIPVPGLDLAATYAVWGKMVHEIGKVYGEKTSMSDAKALAAELFTGVVKTTLVWFGSAQTAASVLKLFPGAGTAAAYFVDAAVAAYGAKKITSALGLAAVAYFENDRELDQPRIHEAMTELLKNPKILKQILKNLKR